ncbi:MAG: magnesium transporter CorA family protein [Bacteroidaceae bacterium]|nr:magnesium transporter CorA family protein [Prevotellaceae bacterium]MDY5632448.1 magnesium transporter CorA family protein [Bacteroidaceae bacterium]
MRTFWKTKHGLRTIDTWEPDCWVQVTCPSQEDTDFLVQKLGVPDYYVSDIADTDERARYDVDDGWVLIILRIPYVKEVRSRTPFTTIPMGIIMRGNVCVTICNYETNMMIDFVSYQQKRGLGFVDGVDMTFRIFLSSAVWYLKRLKQISALIDKSKQNLDRNVDNEDLIGLSRLQDSLTYFITSIRGNENLLSKLKFKLPVDELDADLIEDVSIEMTQARETTAIYSNILDSTLDTYANVINNNMSKVMKILTSISIIMMCPNMISGLFGMNLLNGMETWAWGFPVALLISILVTVIFWWYFKRKSWF